MLTVAIICGQVMHRFHQPAVLGELIGGILLGPTVFGALAPYASAWLFPQTGPTVVARDALTQIAMLFFLFVTGLEVNLVQLRGRKSVVVLTSVLGCVIPFGLGYAAVYALPSLWRINNAAMEPLTALFIGTALSISALPVIARILMDLGLLRSEVGAIILASAVINDLAGWSLFAVILGAYDGIDGGTNLWRTLGLVGGFVMVVLSLGRWFGQPLVRWARTAIAWPQGFLGIVTVFILLAGAGAELIGLHAVFGAFLVGAAVSKGLGPAERETAHDTIYQLTVSVLAPLYFVSIGLNINFVTHFDIVLVSLVILIASVGKIVGAGMGAKLGGMPSRESLMIGAGMNARGAIEIILASIALESGLIDERIFVALVVMALVTSMMTGPLLGRLVRHAPEQLNQV